MKLRETIRYELWYQLRRPATWIYLVALMAIVWQMTTEAQIADAKSGATPVNAPFTLAMIALYGGVIALLPIAAIAGEAAARDVHTRLSPLVYTTPVGKTTYLAGRLLAALALVALLVAMVPSGILLAVAATDVAPDLLGPLRPAYYAAAYLLVGLPNAIVAAGCAFAMATLGRRPMAGYIAVVLLFACTLGCWLLLAGRLGQWTLASLLDPLGLTPLGELSRAWTPAAKRTALPQLAMTYLRNRALWLGLTAAALAYTHRRFRFAHHAVDTSRTRPAPTTENAAPAVTPLVAGRATRTFGPHTRVRQLAAVAGESWRVIVRGWGGLVMLAITALVAITGPNMMEFLGVPLVPVTAHIAAYLSTPGELLTILPPLLVIYYAGELVWRDRDAGMGEIAGAAPIPDGTYVLGRVAGLGLALATFQALMMTAAIVVQLRMGMTWTALEPTLHLRHFLIFQLADPLLLAALAVVVHVVVAHRYVGHLLMMLVVGIATFRFGVEHPLLVFAGDPGWSYSDLRGFAGSVAPWLTLELYWGAWTALLLVGAALLWTRGREDTLGARVRMARRRLTPRTLGTASVAAALVLSLGGFAFYNTNVLNAYRPAAAREALSARYERRYARFADAPQPTLDGVRLVAELSPARGRAEIRTTYRLVNRGTTPIDSIHVTTHASVVTGALTFDRPTRVALSDDALGYRIYALGTPLAPGDTLGVAFTVHVGRPGFASDGVDDLVTANGTFLRNTRLPVIGYQRERELTSIGRRRDFGLAPRVVTSSLAGTERIALDAIIATDSSQRAVAPGALVRTWTEHGRRWFHYATERPIRNDFALYSARYDVRSARWRDVDLEVVHHPGHAWNVGGMLASIRASLAYLSAELGPYPYRELRLVEHAGRTPTLHASPINVSYEEGFALLDPAHDGRGLDFPFAVVAHELAHQWWGNQLMPADVDGSALLSESLAWYSALGIVEQARGAAERDRLVALMREAWRPPRAPNDPPLLRANSWFLGYRKGPLALYALREYVGAERMNATLRRFLASHANGEAPLPTSTDLYHELETATPDSLRYLLHDLFAENTLWELATDSVTSAPMPNGMVRLTLDVRARKTVTDTSGTTREVPMNDLIEVGTSEHHQLQRIRSGAQRLTITVPATATSAGIDPRSLLFDLKPANNVARLR